MELNKEKKIYLICRHCKFSFRREMIFMMTLPTKHPDNGSNKRTFSEVKVAKF